MIERNFTGVQYAELRQQIDSVFNQVHDALSAAYYGGQPFANMGVLTKEEFDRLHGLIFNYYTLFLYQENAKRAMPYPIQDEIKDRQGNVAGSQTGNARAAIALARAWSNSRVNRILNILGITVTE